MKKIILLTAAILISLSCFGENPNHLQFRNIPIDGPLDQFVEAMKKEGFTLKSKGPESAIMQGKFVGLDCEVAIDASSRNKTVWKVTVSAPEHHAWNSIKRQYMDFKQQYSIKYGMPESYELFRAPYYEGDSYEPTAVRNDNAYFSSSWETADGTITLRINKTMQVQFVYQDIANSGLSFREKNANIQDEI